MLDKIQKDITDIDIDKLFINDDSSVLKDDKKTIDVPEELNVSKKSNRIKRPKNSTTEKKRIKDEKKEIEKSIEDKIEKSITEVKPLRNFEHVRKFIKKLIKHKDEEREKTLKNKNLINQLKNKDLYKSTDCTFHIYQPRHIMGDIIYCSCKFCSVEKQFTQSEWDEYCLKYRKWF